MKRIILIIISVFALFCSANAQEIQVSGTVKDNLGETLPGVNIVEKGTMNGTISDLNGKFTISVSGPQASLVFSFVSYKVQTVALDSKRNMEITLQPDFADIEEVVVVGYGTQKKASVVGAISSVNADELTTVATSNLSNTIGGRVSGVITQMGEGQPGNDDAEIFIRGRATTNSAEPLVLIDGLEGSLSRINPNDIESFSVLKDASATAVYGVRGANGVILITTKRGSVGKGKITVNSSVRFHQVIRYPDFLNSYDHARMYNEALRNAGAATNFYSEDDLELFRNGEDPYGHPDVDWMDLILQNPYMEQRHDVNLRGGTDRVKYFVSGELTSQEGAYKQFDDMDYSTNSTYNRMNLRMNFDFKVSESTELSVNLSSRLETVNNVNDFDYSGEGRNVLWDDLMRLRPMAYPPINPDGSYGSPDGSASDPLTYAVLRQGGFVNDRKNNLQGSLKLNQKLDVITKGLSFNLMGGLNTTSGYGLQLNEAPSTWLYSAPTDSYTQMTRQNLPRYILPNKENSINQLGHVETSLNYNRLFNEKHRITALSLYYQDTRTNGANAPTNHLGMAGRVTYGYKDKYLAEVNLGYNGSDQFNEDNRYAFLPAGSLGWVISEENFFKTALPQIDYLKFRGSYGTAGNDKIGNFKYLYTSNYNSVGPNPKLQGYYFGLNQVGVSGLQEGDIGNDRVSWEIAKKQNYGFDMKLLNNALGVTADYFFEKRTNILAKRQTVTDAFGLVTGLPAENIGIVQNQGFEVQLSYNKQFGDLKINLNGNYSLAKNKIVFIDEVNPVYDYQSRTDKPIGQHFGYIWTGEFYSYNDLGYVWDESVEGANKYVLPDGAGPNVVVPESVVSPGDLRYVDRNEDGVIDAYDIGDIGKPNVPTSIYGLNCALNYKNFGLSMFWQGASGFSIDTKAYTTEFQNGAKAMSVHLDRWAYFPEDGIDTRETATYPRLMENSAPETRKNSTFHLKDGTYIRLKNIELSYNIPDRIVQKLKMDYLKVYVNGNNLLTFDEVKIIDPETRPGRYSAYPQSRFVGMGINIGF